MFEDDQTIFFGDSTYIKITDYNPLTLLYGTKEDIKNIEIADSGHEWDSFSIYKIDNISCF